MTVNKGVETTSVKSLTGRDLTLEATGGRLEVVGGEGGLSIEGGFSGGSQGVEILSNEDMSLESQSGSVSQYELLKSHYQDIKRSKCQC